MLILALFIEIIRCKQNIREAYYEAFKLDHSVINYLTNTNYDLKNLENKPYSRLDPDEAFLNDIQLDIEDKISLIEEIVRN